VIWRYTNKTELKNECLMFCCFRAGFTAATVTES